MLLRPLRRAPMMLGGVGFQAGLDETRRKRIEAQVRYWENPVWRDYRPYSELLLVQDTGSGGLLGLHGEWGKQSCGGTAC